VVSDGTIEGLKWLALVLMVLDHVNKYLWNDSALAIFATGRLVMPLFSFVLAYNLARPGVIAGGGGLRTLKRLCAVGAIASVPFIALGGLAWGWWPLNIMTMLAVTVGVIMLIESSRPGRKVLAAAVFVVGGAFVEFWWPGIVIGVAAYLYCKRPSWPALIAWALGLASLYIINSNWWALAALPVIFLAPYVRVRVLRHVIHHASARTPGNATSASA